jgi:hypothetical protein
VRLAGQAGRGDERVVEVCPGAHWDKG